MPYLNQSDQVNLMLMNNQNMKVSDIVADVIKEDRKDEVKIKMKDGDKYYKIKQAILDKNFNEVIIDGARVQNPLISNAKLIHPFHRILVDQKIGYIVGKPIKIVCEDTLLKKLNDLLGHDFDKLMQNWGTGASNKGVEILHPYINSEGGFDLAIVPAEQIIFIYDSQYQKDLTGVIRYYTITQKKDRLSTPRTITKVELWDSEKTYFMIEDDMGKYIPDPDQKENPRPHFYEFNTISPEVKEGKSWGKLPFIKLCNNSIEMSDLDLYKTLSDDYDNSRSTMSNNLNDIQELFWLIFGADDTNLGEFIRNLKTYRAANIPAGSDVKPQKGEVPFEARKEHDDSLWEDIFFFGMGINWKSDTFRNPPSGVALKTLFVPLDLKANALILEWKTSLQELMYFCCKYIEMTGGGTYKFMDIAFEFNKSLIINDLELSQIAQNAKGIISDETIAESHPLNKDPEVEKERMKKQIEQNAIDFSNVNIGNGDTQI